jgi:hypothetical protein
MNAQQHMTIYKINKQTTRDKRGAKKTVIMIEENII